MLVCLPLILSSPKVMPVSAAENEEDIPITILNYHKVDNMNIALSVLPEDFDRQMAYLKENGYNTINTDQLYDYMVNGAELPENPIMITFDDGYEDNYQNAYPILKKYGFTGTIFVITDFVSNQPNYLTWEQIKEMKANGMDFQSHTASHKSMTELTEAQLKDELTRSKQTLDTQLNQDTKFMAYPTGTYNLYIAKLVNDAGYRGAFTIKYGNVDRASNIYALERVPIFHTENTDRSTGCVGNLRGGDAVSLGNFMTLSELQKGLFTEGSVCFTIQVEITMKNKCRKESRFTDICIV